MNKVSNDQRGFSALETILLLIIVAIIAGVGGYVLHANNKAGSTINAANKSSSTTAKSDSQVLDIKEWNVKMTLPTGLKDLTYELTEPTTSTAYGGANGDQPYEVTNPAYVKLISPQLKGKPSSCTDETSTSGEFSSIDRSSTDPNSQPHDGQLTADNLRHIGKYYYVLSQPNGLSCQSSDALKDLEGKQTDLAKQAFKTLREDNN